MDPSVDIRTIATSCNGYVGADMEALCREATMYAVRRSSDANGSVGVLSLTMGDWKHAQSIVGPSITRGVTVEIPKVTWEDIGGLKDLKVCILDFLFCIESLVGFVRIPYPWAEKAPASCRVAYQTFCCIFEVGDISCAWNSSAWTSWMLKNHPC